MAVAENNWKDHPVIIAAASAAAALVFAQTVIFPTMTASLQNEVSSLRGQTQEISSLRSQIKKMEEETKVEKQKYEEEAKVAKQKLVDAQLTNFFSLGNPYPAGLGKVKIGDSIQVLQNAFPDNIIKRDSIFYWSVPQDHAAIRSITYFFDRPRDLKDRRIRMLLMFGTDKTEGVLQGKLVEAFGQPATPGPKPECFIWTIDKLFVKKDIANGFSIESTQPECKIPEK